MSATAAFTLRPMTLEDLEPVVDVERRAHVAPWSPELLRQELDHAWATVLVCQTDEGRVVGHVVFWLVHDEVHVLNVAADPDYQRRGIGRRLVQAAESMGLEKGAVLSTLEVRRSNAPAIALYQSQGYAQVGVRPRYYSDNGEDALVMTKSLVAP